MELSQPIPAVRISLKKSSTKDGGEGWDIDVTSEACDADVAQAVDVALNARQQLRIALGLETDGALERQLEASVAKLTAEGA